MTRSTASKADGHYTRTTRGPDGRAQRGRKTPKKGYATLAEAQAEARLMAMKFDRYEFDAYQCRTCSEFHVGRTRPGEVYVAPKVEAPPRHDDAAMLELGRRVVSDMRLENHGPRSSRLAYLAKKGQTAEMRARYGHKVNKMRPRQAEGAHAVEWRRKMIEGSTGWIELSNEVSRGRPLTTS